MKKQTKMILLVAVPMATIPWLLLLLLGGWPIPKYQLETPFPYLMTAFAFLAGLWWVLRWYGNE